MSDAVFILLCCVSAAFVAGDSFRFYRRRDALQWLFYMALTLFWLGAALWRALSGWS